MFAVPYWLLNLVLPGRQTILKATVSGLVVASGLLLDYLHLRVFGVHLDLNIVETGVYAIRSGEISIDPGGSLYLATGVVALSVAAGVNFAFLTALKRLGQRNRPVQALAKPMTGLLASGALLLLFQGTVIEQARQLAGLHGDALLPGQRLTLLSLLPGSLSGQQEDAFHERMNANELKAFSQQRLALLNRLRTGPLAMARTPNILVVHVESLRSDQLNETHMPFLWEETRRCLAEETCIVGQSIIRLPTIPEEACSGC